MFRIRDGLPKFCAYSAPSLNGFYRISPQKKEILKNEGIKMCITSSLNSPEQQKRSICFFIFQLSPNYISKNIYMVDHQSPTMKMDVSERLALLCSIIISKSLL